MVYNFKLISFIRIILWKLNLKGISSYIYSIQFMGFKKWFEKMNCKKCGHRFYRWRYYRCTNCMEGH